MSSRSPIGLLAAALALSFAGAMRAQTLIAIDDARRLFRVEHTTGRLQPFGAADAALGTPGAITCDLSRGRVFAASTSAGALFELAPLTGATTLLGHFGAGIGPMRGLAFDATADALFGCANGVLFRIDVGNGLATAIGPTGIGGTTCLAVDVLTGGLRGLNAGTNGYYDIDRLTGAATRIGLLGGPRSADGMAFDLVTGSWFAVDSVRDALYSIDPQNGHAALIGSTGPGNLRGLTPVASSGTYTLLGAGCAGSLGIPTNTAATGPAVGATIGVRLDGLPRDLAVFAFGFDSAVSTVVGPLPFDLAPLGAPGCALRIDVAGSRLVVGTEGRAIVPLAVPNEPASLIGLVLFTQAIVVDDVHPGGFTVSDAAAARIGL